MATTSFTWSLGLRDQGSDEPHNVPKHIWRDHGDAASAWDV